MPQLSKRCLELNESPTVALADRVRQKVAAGERIVALQTGDPDWATPAPIVEAARHALARGQTHYSFSRGLPELRQAIAEQLQEAYGVSYDGRSEILVTCGAVHAIYVALKAVLNPGDEVLLGDPAWMTYDNIVRSLGARSVRVPGQPQHNFWPTLDAWSAAVTPQTVALVINSPNNPTGSMADRTYLERLNAFADHHDLYVISDEVYDHIVYDDNVHVCFASLDGARERTLLVNSFSKTFAMTGWRVGYLAAPARVAQEVLKVIQSTVTHVPPFVQAAAFHALTDRNVADAVSTMLKGYTQRRETVRRLLKSDSEMVPAMPQGAFYFFFDLRHLNVPSVEMANRLLEEYSVAMVPGSVYGACGEGFLRMTIAAPEAEVSAGVEALLDWVSTGG